MKLVYVDTEFNGTQEMYVTPVCACFVEQDNTSVSFDTRLASRNFCREYVEQKHRDDYVFVSYAFEAEARFFQAIGFDPLRNNVRCIDLYILYRLLANRFDEIQYGKHLVDGVVKFLKKPPSKWEKEDSDEDNEKGTGFSQMQYGLASATYKFTGEIRDTEDKEACRKRIIQGGDFTPEEMQWIMRYCYDDTKFLPILAKFMFKKYFELVPGANIQHIINLSSYSIHTAEMVRIGYPIEMSWLQKVVDAVPILIKDLQRDLLKESRELGLDFIPLRYDRKEDVFKENQKLIKLHIENNYPHYEKTDAGGVSLQEDDLRKLMSPASEPKKFIDHFAKYRLLKKTLNSFKPGKGKRGIADYCGADERCRPYFGIFGAQSSRSQPASSGFIFLKDVALRHLVYPKRGKMIVGIDYSSQEFLINAILSDDKAMMAAYKSGDPYMYLAKAMGTVPQHGTRKDYGPQRTVAKEMELGLSFGMGAGGVAIRAGLTKERAIELIAMREGVYENLVAYRKELRKRYKYMHEPIVLKDGWAHGPGNTNDLSMLNCPTQGHGAVVMREAVRMSHVAELPVIMTLHDALYFEIDDNRFDLIKVADDIMIQAFANIMGTAAAIRTEIHVWGPCFPQEYRKDDRGRDCHWEGVVPGTDTHYTYENMYWDERVSVDDRIKWHSFVLAGKTGLFD